MEVVHLSIEPLPARFLTCGLEADAPCRLIAASSTFELSPGSPIFLSRDAADAIWNVVEGSVVASWPGGRAEQQRSGEGIYGLTEAIAGITYRSSLHAETFCRCTRVGRDDLVELLGGQNRACLGLLRELARRHLTMVAKLAS